MPARKLVGLALWSLLLGGVALAQPPSEEEEVKTFDVAPGGRVHVTSQDGPVRVDVWQQPQVRLIARKRASAMTHRKERQLLSLMHVRAEKRGPDLFIESRVESFHAFGWVSYGLELEVTVPRKTDLEVRCRDGSIRLAGVEGSIDIRSGDGSIQARDLTGEIAISAEDGSLDLEGVNGRVRAEASDGSISYRGRPLHLELRTGDGSIAAEILPGAHMASNWTLRTADGSVDLSLPPDFNADLDASALDGRVAVDFPSASSTSRSRRRWSGRLNSGGHLLSIRTSDGSIHVGRR